MLTPGLTCQSLRCLVYCTVVHISRFILISLTTDFCEETQVFETLFMVVYDENAKTTATTLDEQLSYLTSMQ